METISPFLIFLLSDGCRIRIFSSHESSPPPHAMLDDEPTSVSRLRVMLRKACQHARYTYPLNMKSPKSHHCGHSAGNQMKLMGVNSILSRYAATACQFLMGMSRYCCALYAGVLWLNHRIIWSVSSSSGRPSPMLIPALSSVRGRASAMLVQRTIFRLQMMMLRVKCILRRSRRYSWRHSSAMFLSALFIFTNGKRKSEN